MKPTKQRILSIFLCICMLFSVMPVSAYAADDGNNSISDYDTFVERLAILEELAMVYSMEVPETDPNALVIKYIRTGVDRYNSGSWGIMAGYEDADFSNFVSEMEQTIKEEDGVDLGVTDLKNLKNMKLPNGQMADIGHMFGTMDITYHNNGGVNHADVGGWAGDLVDLLSATDRHYVKSSSFEGLVEEIRQNYLLKSLNGEADVFSEADMYGDLDAFYVMTKLYQIQEEEVEYPLTTIISEYFTEELTDEFRADFLIKNRFDEVSLRADLREAVYKAYVGNSVVTTLEGTRDFVSDNLSELRKACCYAFADYLCELAGDYIVTGENEQFNVFSSETTKLAPGIVQKINKATSSDGKQMVYYTSTIDINRDDVNVYANYHANDPSQGWAMSRVEDQMKAAQEKYGNPESDSYIENYNVICGTNGAGYNMETGEPGGLLVMGGVEYHPVNGNGFFGILNDGSAVIGTTAEYNSIYKGKVSEGIAGFGAMLIEDGKIVTTDDGTRASRTAVGITATGKVVLMVLDGRQEPVSCGGTMVEIANIMLEAGCVKAVNLDGGGSTTYVAKQPGDETFGVVNKPSDGFARSVSTSLMAVSTAPSTTAFDHAKLETEYKYMTLGNTIQITAKGISASGDAAEIPEGTNWAVRNERYGTITEDGIYTSQRLGDNEIYLMLGDEVVGSTVINCVTPDNIYFTRDNVDVVYGSSVTLPIAASYEGKRVAFRSEDVVYQLSNNAGTMSGNTFTAYETSTLKKISAAAILVGDENVKGSINISLYKQGEATFDFDKATSGDRMFAWMRTVTNSTLVSGNRYEIVDPNQGMEASYIFALDMTQIPIPEQLAELTYMLPGADMEGASAWNFLLQLAERVSVLTEVKPVMYFDKNFDVDYSELKVVNEYFYLTDTEFNEEENSVTVTLKWKDQTKAIDPATANPMCIVSGIKVTPKEDAEWNNKNQLTAVVSGSVSYDIYLRASALYSFAQKTENQEKFGLYPFVNEGVILESGTAESGAHFMDKYVEFTDTFTLDKNVKNGWIIENGDYYYYQEGVKYTGIQQVDGVYYDFGTTGACPGGNPYNGLIIDELGVRYCINGICQEGWWFVEVDDVEYAYYFDGPDKTAITGQFVYNGISYEFGEDGRLFHGTWVTTEKGTRYYYGGNLYYKFTFKEIDGKTYYFNDAGYMETGLTAVTNSKGSVDYTWYVFDKNGEFITGNGLKKVDEDIYYLVDNVPVSKGLVQDDEGNYYFINSRLKAVKGCWYEFSTKSGNGLMPGGRYYFNDDGTMVVKQGLIWDDDGEIRYYENGVAVAKGLVRGDDGYYYYINSSKVAVRNGKYWISKTNGLVAEGSYTFLANGRMEYNSGLVHDEDGEIRYYIDGQPAKAGLVYDEVNDCYYFINSTRKAVKSCWYAFSTRTVNGITFQGGTYWFDENGKMQLKEGLYFEQNGDIRYYVNGQPTKPGLVYDEVNDCYYFINSTYKAVKDCWYEFSTRTVNGITFYGGAYLFDENGKMQLKEGLYFEQNGDIRYYVNGQPTKPGLVYDEVNDCYYFINSTYKAVKDCWYEFSTRTVNGITFQGGAYWFDENGKMQLKEGLYFEQNGDIRYYVNGQPTKPGLVYDEVNDCYYFINSTYKAVKNCWYEFSTRTVNGVTFPGGNYWFDEDGKLVF